jgi:hypothetical protein
VNWKNRRIISQYGLICKVIDQKEINGETILTCLADYKEKIWEWSSDTVGLITRNNEILDVISGEIYGKIMLSSETQRDKYDLYHESERRILSREEVLKEFDS